MSDKKKIINSHIHVFTYKHVPPYLSKKILPAPLYKFLNLDLVVWIAKKQDALDRRMRKPDIQSLIVAKQKLRLFVSRSTLMTIVKWIVTLYLLFASLYFISHWVSPTSGNWFSQLLDTAANWLESHKLFYKNTPLTLQVLAVVIFLLFFNTGRRIFFLLISILYSFLSFLPGKNLKAIVSRYWLIATQSRYEDQSDILSVAIKQYPPKTALVILPMDLEYIEAGDTKEDYIKQMEELKKMKLNGKEKDSIYPFVFIDPRRLKENANYFSYTIGADGRMVLDKNCFVKQYVEDAKFAGFKMYPALGYYPFDENLLPVYKYAVENDIPIMSHVNVGPVHFRGEKDKAWDQHPFFHWKFKKKTEEKIEFEIKPLFLPEYKNAEFQRNFTHPLNYLCVLEEKLLHKVLTASGNQKLQELFGYSVTGLKSNLRDLKMCMAHYGGAEGWYQYLEADRNRQNPAIISQPEHGIEFFKTDQGEETPNIIAQLWQNHDWYSIITSMMMQYPKVYADVSYILYDQNILPLLKETLQIEKIRERVLYGTDFYVVRNHKTEHEMLANMRAGLDEKEFDLIARDNPHNYLTSKFHTP